MNNYRETPNQISQADRQRFASGIAKMAAYAEELHALGELPERFTTGRFETVVYDGRSGRQLQSQLTHQHVNISEFAMSKLESSKFTTSEPQTCEIEILTVSDLIENPKRTLITTSEMDQARREKGLEYVPADTAPQFLIQHGDKLKPDEVIYMSMETGENGFSRIQDVLMVARSGNGLWLGGTPSGYSGAFKLDDQIAFFRPQSVKA